MILRIDKLAIELPVPKHPSSNSASAVQELLGGKFGESAPRAPWRRRRCACGIDKGLLADVAGRLFAKSK